ncbi:hypothetical protein SPHV1_2350035 [Novosphingobium sp. KN65.2]|nr:hypothetical protein SPHV1_2350035 [Novosphingobium sp. KN65.2]
MTRHTLQPSDLAREIGAAPVRTVHYKTATAVRPSLRSDFSLRRHVPEGARLPRRGPCPSAGGTPAG